MVLEIKSPVSHAAETAYAEATALVNTWYFRCPICKTITPHEEQKNRFICQECGFSRPRKARPDVKEKQRAYRMRPDVKEKKRAYRMRQPIKLGFRQSLRRRN